jgi:hypothetical protein
VNTKVCDWHSYKYEGVEKAHAFRKTPKGGSRMQAQTMSALPTAELPSDLSSAIGLASNKQQNKTRRSVQNGETLRRVSYHKAPPTLQTRRLTGDLRSAEPEA